MSFAYPRQLRILAQALFTPTGVMMPELSQAFTGDSSGDTGGNEDSVPMPLSCRVEKFLDREVELLKCREGGSCPYKQRYDGYFICVCPQYRHRYLDC